MEARAGFGIGSVAVTVGTRVASEGTFASAPSRSRRRCFGIREVAMHTFRRLAYRATGGVIDLRSDQDLIADYDRRLAREYRTRPRPPHKRRNGRASDKAPSGK